MRKRKEDNWLPKRVYAGRSAYEFHPKNGGAIRLCELAASKETVWQKYEEVRNREDSTPQHFGWLLDKYYSSPHFKGLAPDTQKGYEKHGAALKKVFGAQRRNSIRPDHIRQYLDLVGEKSTTLANAHVRFMKAVFSWGYERRYAESNPCKGVKLFTEKSRTVWPVESEYRVVLKHASPMVYCAMELAWRAHMREKDIIELRVSQLEKEGIRLIESKTGKEIIREWNPQIRAAIARARSVELKDGIRSIYVIHTSRGTKYTRDGFYSGFRRARDKASAELKKKIEWTFHDLKAKGPTEMAGTRGKKLAFTNHKNERMLDVYDRSIPILPTIGDDS